MRDALDRFYTQKGTAVACVQKVSKIFVNPDVVFEPSAGEGAFIEPIKEYLPNADKKFYDIDPKHPEAIQKDFLKLSKQELFEKNNDAILQTSYDKIVMAVGNPPFGQRSALAKKFIKHCMDLEANVIAFILPDTFSKEINQRIFPKNWRLILEEKLPKNSFVFEGVEFHIPCTFYLWTSCENVAKDHNLRKYKPKKPVDYCFVARGSNEADFTINGTNGRVKNLTEITNSKAEHYIRVNDRTNIEKIRQNFSKLNFDFKSSVNGGVAWINQDDINEAYGTTYPDSIQN